MDDLPPLEPIDTQSNFSRNNGSVSDDIAIFVSRGLEPSFTLHSTGPERSANDDIGEMEPSSEEEMPELRSVSASSDEEESYNQEEEEESEWSSSEWEDEPYTDEDMPTLERLIPGQPDAPVQEEPSISRARQSTTAQSFASSIPELPRREQRHDGLPDVVSFDFLEALFNSPPMDHTDEVVDLERAKTLVGGLEKLPNGLLLRMIRVGGAPGAYEDVDDDENVVHGCAICWLSLFAEEGNQVVSLPCAHVFHSTCLLPWFSRKTSCPVCRFNIDPQSLTRTPRTIPDNRRQQPREGNREQEEEEEAPSFRQLMQLYESDALSSWRMSFRVRGESLYRFDHSAIPSRPRPAWTLPECPGPSLREIIETKEREHHLRCFYKPCIFAPTDGNPQSEEARIMRQITIQLEEASIGTCKHSVHPACLVLSTRTFKMQTINIFNKTKVRCPSCGLAGAVTEGDWREGELSLEVC